MEDRGKGPLVKEHKNRNNGFTYKANEPHSAQTDGFYEEDDGIGGWEDELP